MLNVTEGHLQDLLNRFESLDDPVLSGLADRDAYDFLNRVLYLDDDRSNKQVSKDAERFLKFDLLTNGGESFDRTKSFIVADGDRLRLLFQDDERGFVSAHVGRSTFVLTVRGFLAWVADEGRNAG